MKHDHTKHESNHANEFFPRPLDVREVGEGKWKLLSDYIYHDVDVGEIVVPEGFVSDLYSIPRVVRSLVSKIQSSNGPAVVHDWLYRSQILGPSGQAQADKVLRRAMGDHWCPVSWWQRAKILAGLKVGGCFSYKRRGEQLQDYSFLLGGREPTIEEIKENL